MISEKNKRGSHVGMIISFIVFVTFIVFLYSVVRPVVSIGQDKKTIADYLVVKIVENVSSDFNSTSVQILDNVPQDCISLTGFFTLLVNDGITFESLVQNEFRVLQTESYRNVIGDLVIDRTDSDNTFFRIYTSAEYDALSEREGCVSIPQNSYKIGGITSNRYPFKHNFEFLIASYEANYTQLKVDWNIPAGTDFGFEFTESDGTKTEVGEIPESVDVYAEEIPLQYIDEEANILSGFINIKVW
ncbi:MAG: hypothetical protein M1416_02195 [Candidatus Pacearchaeota archaeon]|nr:hypothetical protein [Candidatus Pacearchaeota archaeon]